MSAGFVHQSRVIERDPSQPLPRPEALLAAFADDPRATFMRVCTHEQPARPILDVLGVDLYEAIRLDGRTNPFNSIRDKLKSRATARDASLPMFQGGAIGIFDYECVRYVEPVLAKVGNMSHPGIDAAVSFHRTYVLVDHIGQRVLVLSGYFPKEESVVDGEKAVAASMANTIERVTKLLAQSETPVVKADDSQVVPLTDFRANLGREKYIAGVKKLKEHIRAGDIFQAVLSDRFELDIACDPYQLFQSLLRVASSPYQFYFPTNEGVLVGSSPEMLVRVEGRTLETHPIAGTRPRGANPAEDQKLKRQLLRSTKENAEHIMLVDLARNDLGRVSTPGTVDVREFRSLKIFPELYHLVSVVTGQLAPEKHAMDALAACFPAGTLSGAPKVRAMHLLAELEQHRRGVYGGAVILAGYDGDMESCISIRCARVEPKKVILQAGAGVVADSSPEKEYREVEHKTRGLRRAIASAVSASKAKDASR